MCWVGRSQGADRRRRPDSNRNGGQGEHDDHPHGQRDSTSARYRAGDPALWVVRDELGLTGTKFGCGIAQCGACTVHVNGRGDALVLGPGRRRRRQERSPPSRGSRPTAGIRCSRPGLPRTCRNAATASPARSWRSRRSCKQNPHPTDADIDASITNICRCGTYPRIRAAIHRAAAMMRG